jgi:hypothetical protein
VLNLGSLDSACILKATYLRLSADPSQPIPGPVLGTVTHISAFLYAHSYTIDRNPSPPTPRGWPLSWVKQVLQFDEGRLNELRGVDAAFYVRFMRGCCTSRNLSTILFLLTFLQSGGL